VTSFLENTTVAIALKAQELADKAYEAGIRAEQKDWFRRAVAPPGQRVDPAQCQMSVKRAKEIGGKYALCVRLGEKQIPSRDLFETIEGANTAWRERADRSLTVGCACRYSRRWEMPRFNPLYAETAPEGEIAPPA